MLDFIFPRVCHVCNCSISTPQKYICPACLMKLPRTNYHRIPGNAMEQRFMGIIPYERIAGHFFYKRDTEFAGLIHDFKYRKFPGLARYLGEIVGQELLPTGFFADIEIVMPIPIHWTKRAVRGYNQTDEIAKGISEASGIKIANNLRAARPHKTQTSLTLDQRVKNTADVFKIKNPEDIEGKSILLVDDVCTTGSTLISAAKTILQTAPRCKISILTLGVTF